MSSSLYKCLVTFHDCQSLGRNPQFEKTAWKLILLARTPTIFAEKLNRKSFQYTKWNNEIVPSDI